MKKITLITKKAIHKVLDVAEDWVENPFVLTFGISGSLFTVIFVTLILIHVLHKV